MEKKVIRTDKAPAPIGPYNQAIQYGDMLFVSGQIAIDPATFQPRLLDQPQQPLILPLPRRDRRCAPGIVAAGMHFHHPAHASHRMLGFMSPDECVPYRDSLAKYAAAFFRMSRSSVTRLSSALSSRNSAC